MEEYTISRDDSIYEAFPDMIRLDNGELICIFMQCMHHTDRRNVSLCISRSFDNGKTWTPKAAFTETLPDGMAYNCPRISKLKDGTLVVICDMMPALDVTDNNVLCIWRSSDNGRTWSEPQKLNFEGIVPDKYRELSNGRHIIALHKKGRNGKLEQYMYYSDDGGESWSAPVLVAADERYNLCEACILEVKPGTLVAFMRENSWEGLPCFKSISEDYGLTWHGLYETRIDCCHRPVVDYIGDGQLLMTYRYAQGGRWGFGFQNFFGAIFDVDTVLAKKREEQQVRIFPIAHDRSSAADTGYSGWACISDDEIYVVTYLVDDAPKAYIKGYLIKKSDILL